MKLTWIFVILLLVLVAIFSVQNADPITVHFLPWEVTLSGALVIQLAALLGALVGIAAAALSRRTSPEPQTTSFAETAPPLPQQEPPPPAVIP